MRLAMELFATVLLAASATAAPVPADVDGLLAPRETAARAYGSPVWANDGIGKREALPKLKGVETHLAPTTEEVSLLRQYKRQSVAEYESLQAAKREAAPEPLPGWMSILGKGLKALKPKGRRPVPGSPAAVQNFGNIGGFRNFKVASAPRKGDQQYSPGGGPALTRQDSGIWGPVNRSKR